MNRARELASLGEMSLEQSKNGAAGQEVPGEEGEMVPFLSTEPTAQGMGVTLIGFVIAAWGAMCGIGGGLFAVPVMHYLYRIKLKEAITASLALVFATTASATLTEAFRSDSSLHWPVVGGLVVGCLVGAQFGFRAAKVIPQRRVKFIFTFLLLFVGTRLLGVVPAMAHAASGEDFIIVISNMDVGVALLIGLGGGFVAPLLGIGGGLIAVPALMFCLPQLGHPGARACSMAMGVVTSSRSIVLYYRAGDLNLKRSWSFALGAAIGAIVGVQLVHIPGVTEVAEKMLAATLLSVSARFAWDVFGPKKAAAK